MAFQAGSGAKGNNRYLMSRTQLDDIADLLSRLREGDGIRRYIGMTGRILTMLFRVQSRRSIVEHPATDLAMQLRHRSRQGQRI